MRALATASLLAILILSGSLGAPAHRDEVPFDSVERQHFDAIGVTRDRGERDRAPLVLRVSLVGDAADADIGVARAWLEERANIVLVEDPRGAPLFLTAKDLSATSGRSTLGATVPKGMAVETANEKVVNCVLVHEVLHFVGLRHVHDEGNIMHPQCTSTRLASSGLTDEQRASLDAVAGIRATTPRGVQVWATRGG